MVKTAGLFEKAPSKFNACVGDNGWVEMSTYIDGYQSATVVMLESVLSHNTIEQGFFWGNDTAVYPILFSAGHFIELFLKQKIYAINYFKLKENIELKLIKTHDIKSLWGIFIEIFEKTHDSRLSEFIDEIEPYIEDFSRIDPTGENFRYVYSSTNEKHLKEQTVICLSNFYKKFKQLSELCSRFSYSTDYLIDEYRIGTFTKKIESRGYSQYS